jgi:predicted HAD superfamily phosphohydrolase
MSEEIKTEAESSNEDFMAGNPTRDEVNKYMNNLFMMINNNFGVFQGYTIAAISATIVDYLKEAGSSVTLQEFTERFSEHNAKVIKEAEERMKEMQAHADKAAAPASQAQPVASKEVDISVL